MTASLALFLPDFELSRMRAFQSTPRDGGASPTESRIDIDIVTAQARAEGEAQARAELSSQHALERDADERRHQAQLAALRAEMETLAAQTIPGAIAARSDEIAELIAGDVAAVLAPLLDAAVRTRILTGLAGEIKSALELENAGQICVSGPEDLVAALRDILGADADKFAILQTDGVDIEIEVDRTRFATRIADWSKALAEGLA